MVSAPLAVASDGTLLINAMGLTTRSDLESLVTVARGSGRIVFIGIALDQCEITDALRQLDEACAEIAARLGGRITAGGHDR